MRPQALQPRPTALGTQVRVVVSGGGTALSPGRAPSPLRFFSVYASHSAILQDRAARIAEDPQQDAGENPAVANAPQSQPHHQSGGLAGEPA